MAEQWERYNVSPTLPGGEPLPGVHSYLRCCSCKSPKGEPHKPDCKVQPDIDWTPDLRLAVIRRIAGQLTDSLGGERLHADQAEYHRAKTIHLISFMNATFLDNHRQNIDGALGCTLADVQKEMERAK
jgi:hypothetical protein